MLNGASDYKFLNVTGISGIQGEILPATHPISNTKAPIRFETLLFLLEAYQERLHLDQAGSNNVSAPDSRKFYWRDLYDIRQTGTYQDDPIDGTSSNPEYKPFIDAMNFGRWVGSNTYMPPSQPYERQYGGGYSSVFYKEYLKSWGLYCPTGKSPYYMMSPSSGALKLNGEYIRALYYTYNSMNKLVMQVRNIDVFSSATYTIYNKDGNIVDGPNDYLTYGYSGLQIICQWTKSTSSSTTTYNRWVVNVQPKPLIMPYAKSATWAFATETFNIDNSTYGCYWFTKPAIVSNGAVNLPSDIINTLINESCALSNTPTDRCQVTWREMYVVVDFEFPARLNGVDFNWQPSYT